MNKSKYFTFRGQRFQKKATLWGFLFILPTMLGIFILNIKPAFETLLMSFQESNGLGASKWVGLANYKRLINDPDFPLAIGNTLRYALLVIPGVVILSLILAVLLNQKIKGVSFYRVMFFLPVVSAPAAIAMIWKWLYNSHYGLINYALSRIGIDGPSWLTDPKFSILSIAIVGIWSGVGYNMILFLAGLQEIPNDYYEASSLDGATPVKQFFSITVPMISPTLFFVTVTTVIDSLQVFDVIYLMFDKKSEVIRHTQTLVYMFYKYSFTLSQKGYGAAIVTALLLITSALTFFQLKLQKKWVNY